MWSRTPSGAVSTSVTPARSDGAAPAAPDCPPCCWSSGRRGRVDGAPGPRRCRGGVRPRPRAGREVLPVLAPTGARRPVPAPSGLDVAGCVVTPGAGQRAPPPAADRVPHAARHARRPHGVVAAAMAAAYAVAGSTASSRGGGARRASPRRCSAASPPSPTTTSPGPTTSTASVDVARGDRRGGARGSARGWCSCAAAPATTRSARPLSAEAIVAALPHDAPCCSSPSARRACTATAPRRSGCSARSRRATGCDGAPRRTSRSTWSRRSSGTAVARSTCSTSGAGWRRTSRSPTCAGSPTTSWPASRRAASTATHAPGCDLPMGWGVAPVAALLDAGVARRPRHERRRAATTPATCWPTRGSRCRSRRWSAARSPRARCSARRRPARRRAWAARSWVTCDPVRRRTCACWDVSGVADAGVADPVAGLLWASPGRRARHVVVAGRVVVRDFVLQTADERRGGRPPPPWSPGTPSARCPGRRRENPLHAGRTAPMDPAMASVLHARSPRRRSCRSVC